MPSRHKNGTLEATRILWVTLSVFACSSTMCRSANSRGTIQQEEYIAWPRNDSAPLSGEFPWSTCNSTTGESCPGVLDWIEHLCTVRDDQTCEGRSNEVISRRQVLVTLLPGTHRVRKDRPLVFPESFWFCNFSLTIRGNKVSDTTVVATKPSAAHQYNRTNNHSCKFWLCGENPNDSAFAFRGGRIRLQDLSFRHLYEGKLNFDEDCIIATLNVLSFEMVRCRFETEQVCQGALSVLFSEWVNEFRVIIQDTEFHTNIKEAGEVCWESIPPVNIQWLLMGKTCFHDMSEGFRTIWPTNFFSRVVSIQSCKFVVQLQTTYYKPKGEDR